MTLAQFVPTRDQDLLQGRLLKRLGCVTGSEAYKAPEIMEAQQRKATIKIAPSLDGDHCAVAAPSVLLSLSHNLSGLTGLLAISCHFCIISPFQAGCSKSTSFEIVVTL